MSWMMIFTVVFTPILASAAAANNEQENVATSEQIVAMAKELAYIFTEIAVTDESTGLYVIDEQALNNSPYSENEKEGIVAVVEYMNDQSSFTIYSNAFKRCWSEAVGIAGDTLDEFLGYVKNKQWIAAAGVLALAGIAIKPISIFIFSLTCGATPVE